MTLNKEELINKILYRSSYRGTKEMDILMKSFVKSIIFDLHIEDLIKLDQLVNLDDEHLIEIKNRNLQTSPFNENSIIEKFIKFKN